MGKERDKKYLIIGSSGHQFVDSIDWEKDPFPNLVDYDVIIVNVRSLAEEFLKTVSSDKIEILRTQLIRFLKSSGRLIVLSDHNKFGKNDQRHPSIYTNYCWSPIYFGIKKEEGDTIEEISVPFPKYFSKFKEWEYYFYIPQDCLTRELIDYCGGTYAYDYCHKVVPFLVNREKRILAGLYCWWTEVKQSAQHHKEKAVELGTIILLPLLRDVDSQDAINLLLEDILGKPQTAMPPLWAEKIRMFPLDDINSKISSFMIEIKKYQEKINDLCKQKENLEYYKKLLYANGTELEIVFKKCLVELGASVCPTRYAQEEYYLCYRKNEYPIETKGNTKSISLTDLRQLIDYLLIYDDKTGIRNKGILLGNAWKNTPINQRNTQEKPIFPSNVIKRAEATNIALVSSIDFFNVFCMFLEKKISEEKILDSIVNSVGVVNFKK